MTRPEHCRSCTGPFGPTDSRTSHKGRGLCKRCWHQHDRNGTLDLFERLTYTHEERLADIMLLMGTGLSRREIAMRMGVSKDCIDVTLSRSRNVSSIAG